MHYHQVRHVQNVLCLLLGRDLEARVRLLQQLLALRPQIVESFLVAELLEVNKAELCLDNSNCVVILAFIRLLKHGLELVLFVTLRLI